MSDLRIDYGALEAAAQGMKSAKAALDDAAKEFDGASTLEGEAFTSKGKKAATWYQQQREDMQKYLTSSIQSYDDLATAFTKVADLIKLLDSQLSKAGTNHGGDH